MDIGIFQTQSMGHTIIIIITFFLYFFFLDLNLRFIVWNINNWGRCLALETENNISLHTLKQRGVLKEIQENSRILENHVYA